MDIQKQGAFLDVKSFCGDEGARDNGVMFQRESRSEIPYAGDFLSGPDRALQYDQNVYI